MATEKDSSPTYSKFSVDIAGRLYELRYRAAGARALLEGSDKYDESSDELVGVYYLLGGLVDALEVIGGEVAESMHRFVGVGEVPHG